MLILQTDTQVYNQYSNKCDQKDEKSSPRHKD